MDPIRFVVSPAAHSRMNQKDRALSALPLLQFVISCLGGRGGGGEGKEREGGWEEGEGEREDGRKGRRRESVEEGRRRESVEEGRRKEEGKQEGG